jgi:NAD-dependent SIR2 family protein deacetylase
MKTIIILGAGASASEGAPIQSELFRDYFKYVNSHTTTIHHSMNRELATFFKMMFNIDVDHGDLDNTDFPTFEEVLGVIDLAIRRSESFKEFDLESMASNGNRLRQIRVYLILLMAKIIKEKLSVGRGIHSNLITNLRTKRLLDKVSFISTNYDILIDNQLSSHDNRLVNYGVEFTNYYREKDWPRPNGNATILLKIHGSLNWLYCSVCNTLTYTPFEKGVVRLVDNFSSCSCPSCKSVILPIIVPPTYFKDMTNVFLNEIWYKAEQELSKAEHIIFCGYSFPDADIHIKYLLKRIQTNKDFSVRFTVINNHTGKSVETKDEERKRYKRFLGALVDYTDKSFEEFSNNPETIIT